jgi:hypothetical protein
MDKQLNLRDGVWEDGTLNKILFTMDFWQDSSSRFGAMAKESEPQYSILADFLMDDGGVRISSFLSGRLTTQQKLHELRTTGKLHEAYDFSSNSWGVDVIGNEVIIYFLYDEDNEDFKQRYTLEEFEQAITDCIEFLRKHIN